MKLTRSLFVKPLAVWLGLAAVTVAPAALAGGHLGWSVGVYGPGVRIAQAPVYVQPAPVVVMPQQQYYPPPAVYGQPTPAYVPPQYTGYAPPVRYRAMPHGHHGHDGWRHGWDQGGGGHRY